MDRLADTQRALIEAAERRGYDRGRADAEADLAALRARIAEAYEHGWHECAKWAQRDDLHHDTGSAAYVAARDKRLAALLTAEGDEGGANV